MESFFQNDEEVKERYANRFWFSVGNGHKLNHNLKFEIIYHIQQSGNTITTEEIQTEVIMHFIVKHTIHRIKKQSEK